MVSNLSFFTQFWTTPVLSAQEMRVQSALAACQYGNMVQLQANINDNEGDWLNQPVNGQLLLHVAVKNGHMELVKCLLDMGAKPDIRDSHGLSAIDYATLTPMGEKILPALLALLIGRNIEELSKTVLSDPSKRGDIEQSQKQIYTTCAKFLPAVRDILTQLIGDGSQRMCIPPEDLKTPIDEEGNTILHLLAGMVNGDVLKYVLPDDFVDFDAIVNKAGQSPLHFACALESGCIQYLIGNKADFNKEDLAGISPLALIGATAMQRDPLNAGGLQKAMAGLILAKWVSDYALQGTQVGSIMRFLTGFMNWGLAATEGSTFFNHYGLRGLTDYRSIMVIAASSGYLGEQVQQAALILKIGTIALSALQGLKKTWEWSSFNPRKALSKAVVHGITLGYAVTEGQQLANRIAKYWDDQHRIGKAIPWKGKFDEAEKEAAKCESLSGPEGCGSANELQSACAELIKDCKTKWTLHAQAYNDKIKLIFDKPHHTPSFLDQCFPQAAEQREISRAKEILGPQGGFNQTQFDLNPENYLNRVFRPIALRNHPDKCHTDMCQQTFEAAKAAKETLLWHEAIKLSPEALQRIAQDVQDKMLEQEYTKD